MTAVVVAIAGAWLLIAAAAWYVTTPPPRGAQLQSKIGRSARFSLMILAYVGAWSLAGFVLLIFATNPPPPDAGRMGMVEIWKYCAFGLASFLIGMACHRSVQRQDRRD